jgi:hypothetical protein
VSRSGYLPNGKVHGGVRLADVSMVTCTKGVRRGNTSKTRSTGKVQPRASAVDEDEAEMSSENDEPRPKTLGAGRFGG